MSFLARVYFRTMDTNISVEVAEQLNLLIFFPDFVLIVEPGVGDLMDGGADRLYLAHAFSEDNALFVHGEVSCAAR